MMLKVVVPWRKMARYSGTTLDLITKMIVSSIFLIKLLVPLNSLISLTLMKKNSSTVR